MTLVEVMIVAVVFLVSALALLQLLTVSMGYMKRARELDVAADDMKDVFEKIKSVGFANVTVAFPNGASVNSSVIGGFSLPDENIAVSYPDPNADPLDIWVTITWNSVSGRACSYTFRTRRTRGL